MAFQSHNTHSDKEHTQENCNECLISRKRRDCTAMRSQSARRQNEALQINMKHIQHTYL